VRILQRGCNLVVTKKGGSSWFSTGDWCGGQVGLNGVVVAARYFQHTQHGLTTSIKWKSIPLDKIHFSILAWEVGSKDFPVHHRFAGSMLLKVWWGGRGVQPVKWRWLLEWDLLPLSRPQYFNSYLCPKLPDLVVVPWHYLLLSHGPWWCPFLRGAAWHWPVSREGLALDISWPQIFVFLWCYPLSCW
jgi:hypothetical protein